MNIAIINGPNLNLQGKREPGLYGSQDFDSFLAGLRKKYPGATFAYFQSNMEGELIQAIQEHGFRAGGIILNAAGYTHTSIAIADAVAAVPCPVIEVHITNIFAREEYRKVSLLSPHCLGIISGMGLQGYDLAVQVLMQKVQKKTQPE